MIEIDFVENLFICSEKKEKIRFLLNLIVIFLSLLPSSIFYLFNFLKKIFFFYHRFYYLRNTMTSRQIYISSILYKLKVDINKYKCCCFKKPDDVICIHLLLVWLLLVGSFAYYFCLLCKFFAFWFWCLYFQRISLIHLVTGFSRTILVS